MSDMPQTVNLELMADKLAGAFPQLDHTGRELALNLIRLLALGAPVGAADLARRVGVPEQRVAEELDAWPGVYRDEDGRVIGHAGLTVLEMGHHRVHLDGRMLSTWCAYDT